MDKQTVTRKDVAMRAGVSISVVSRALNNSGYVSEEKKKKILAVAEEMGYYPHPVAMSLQKRRTKQLLFFCKDLMNSFNIQMYQGMVDTAKERGYMVVLNGNMDFSSIRETMIDGILMPNEVMTEYYLNTMGRNYHLPIVTSSYGSCVHFQKCVPVVEADMHLVMEQAVTYLRRKGHKKIAFAFPYEYISSDARAQAWCGMTSSEGIENPKKYFLSLEKSELDKYPDLLEKFRSSEYGDETEKVLRRENFFLKGEVAAELFLKKGMDATAVLCFNDELAAGMCSKLRERGIQIPDQLSVMGIDGSYIRQVIRPLLTSVCIYPERQGAKCAEVLIDLIEGKKIHYVSRIPMRILEGETVRDIC